MHIQKIMTICLCSKHFLFFFKFFKINHKTRTRRRRNLDLLLKVKSIQLFQIKKVFFLLCSVQRQITLRQQRRRKKWNFPRNHRRNWKVFTLIEFLLTNKKKYFKRMWLNQAKWSFGKVQFRGWKNLPS